MTDAAEPETAADAALSALVRADTALGMAGGALELTAVQVKVSVGIGYALLAVAHALERQADAQLAAAAAQLATRQVPQ